MCKAPTFETDQKKCGKVCGDDILVEGCSDTKDCVVPSVGIPVVRQLFKAQHDASGGNGAYNWSVIGGALPPGYNLSASGYWDVVVTTPGDYATKVRVVDSQGKSGCVTFTWPVQELVITPPSQTITGIHVGMPVSASLSVTGGNGSYSWSVVDGALPTGYAMDKNGVFSGTVLKAGTYTAIIRVTDDKTNTPPISTAGYSEATYTWIITGGS